jgi:hypothetical protein
MFSDTVSNDYLTYMLWQFPTNVTGWICSTLVTSSLLQVGIVHSLFFLFLTQMKGTFIAERNTNTPRRAFTYQVRYRRTKKNLQCPVLRDILYLTDKD